MVQPIIHDKHVFKFFAEVHGQEMPNDSDENVVVNMYDLLCWNPERTLEETDCSIKNQYFVKTSHGNYIIISHTNVNGDVISLKGYKQDTNGEKEHE